MSHHELKKPAYIPVDEKYFFAGRKLPRSQYLQAHGMTLPELHQLEHTPVEMLQINVPRTTEAPPHPYREETELVPFSASVEDEIVLQRGSLEVDANMLGDYIQSEKEALHEPFEFAIEKPSWTVRDTYDYVTFIQNKRDLQEFFDKHPKCAENAFVDLMANGRRYNLVSWACYNNNVAAVKYLLTHIPGTRSLVLQDMNTEFVIPTHAHPLEYANIAQAIMYHFRFPSVELLRTLFAYGWGITDDDLFDLLLHLMNKVPHESKGLFEHMKLILDTRPMLLHYVHDKDPNMLHMVLSARHTHIAKIFQYLLERGVDPNKPYGRPEYAPNPTELHNNVIHRVIHRLLDMWSQNLSEKVVDHLFALYYVFMHPRTDLRMKSYYHQTLEYGMRQVCEQHGGTWGAWMLFMDERLNANSPGLATVSRENLTERVIEAWTRNRLLQIDKHVIFTLMVGLTSARVVHFQGESLVFPQRLGVPHPNGKKTLRNVARSALDIIRYLLQDYLAPLENTYLHNPMDLFRQESDMRLVHLLSEGNLFLLKDEMIRDRLYQYYREASIADLERVRKLDEQLFLDDPIIPKRIQDRVVIVEEEEEEG